MEKRTFEQRTMRYEDVRDMMESARPAILEKARKMGRGAAPNRPSDPCVRVVAAIGADGPAFGNRSRTARMPGTTWRGGGRHFRIAGDS